MITKKINSATENYEDIVTTEMVLDDTPTKGSFNSVTSDGVAKAIEQGGGGGSYSAGDGVSISEGTISAKVDGTTIGFDASGNLKSLASGGSDVLLAVPNTTTAVEIKAAADAGKEVIINDSGSVYNLVTAESGPGGTVVSAVFGRTFLSTTDQSVSATTSIDSEFYLVSTNTPTNVTTWKRQFRYGLPVFDSSTDSGKVLSVREDEGGETELFWADGIPDYSTSDEGKVLGVVFDGGSGYTTDWVSASLLNNTAGITNIASVASLPASPDAHTLYLIPET